MQRMCQKKTNNYGCILLHLLHIDQEHVVVDELHLLMGITDVLFRIVIEDAVRLDPQKRVQTDQTVLKKSLKIANG
jgi:hypothetical protein